MMISHVIGPEEKVALDNHPIKSLYFLGGGLPQVKLKFLIPTSLPLLKIKKIPFIMIFVFFIYYSNSRRYRSIISATFLCRSDKFLPYKIERVSMYFLIWVFS